MIDRDAFRTALMRAAEDFELTLTDKEIAGFVGYYELLIEWNQKMNLTAITAPEEVAVKHMIDSLSAEVGEIFTAGKKVIDVGTGAGFPGLPLKIVHEKIELTLMDSLAKRINFLEEVVRELGLSMVNCVHARAEDAAHLEKYREKYDVAVSRAVARLPILLEYTLPFVKVGGLFIALKGREYEEEADEAKRALMLLGGEIKEILPIKLPGLEDKRAVIVVEKTKATSKKYPRKAGTPKKSPL